MVYRECTRHHRCSLRKISQAGEVNPPLPDLHSLLLAFVLIIPMESLPLEFSRLGALLGKVIRTPALETTVVVVVVGVRCLLHIWPWAILLLLKRC